MKLSILSLLAAAVGSSTALSIPLHDLEAHLQPRQACENTPTSRRCWGDFNIDTDYYTVTPDTGETVEVWLSVQEVPCAPDGYSRTCMTFNGTVPGPTIHANWGDNLVIHVTNNLPSNGTAIHWHGVRQLGSVEYDGVPGVTQCAIAPGDTLTYQFRVTQYGSTWYHSHFSLQYAEGLFGGMVLNGPATADYDEDLGSLFLQDWSHVPAFTRWNVAKAGAPPPLDNGLINGTNTFDCSTVPDDTNCVGGGKKFEAVFEAGKKYRLRLVNVAIDGVFHFSIDGHTLTVIANDLVPIVPYTTDGIQITIGQRYDVIVEANAAPGDYWLRGGWVSACNGLPTSDGITGIIRYDNSSTADPTSTSTVVVGTSCDDEPAASLVPHLALDVTNMPVITTEDLAWKIENSYFKWTINTSSLVLDWGNPTLLQIFNGEDVFPTPYNVVEVAPSGTGPEWAVLVIQDLSTFGISHPIHLHGHDFWVLAQERDTFNGTTTAFNTINPPRRDVAVLPGNGYLAIAFLLDNPGAWLVHCHIAWHASQGLSLEFVESQSSITVDQADKDAFNDTCNAWNEWKQNEVFPQDDSGI
ncbi:lcc2, laccase [Podospora didyma]|uniref:laccase n=1 Tax=Podospora didyma TaxID=330526 RepID=A0AAE0U769_9PEZI|nr:lcc2, laccase [Podospora didyma]